MRQVSRILTVTCLGIGLLLAVGLLGQESKRVMKGIAMQVWTDAELKWVDDADLPGARTAVVWGDPTKGAYGAMHRWAAGTEAPLHWHTHDNRGAMISGTLVITVKGGQPKEVPAGSYIFVPGRLRHTTSCKAGADCVFYAHQPGIGDTKIVGAAAPK